MSLPPGHPPFLTSPSHFLPSPAPEGFMPSPGHFLPSPAPEGFMPSPGTFLSSPGLGPAAPDTPNYCYVNAEYEQQEMFPLPVEYFPFPGFEATLTPQPACILVSPPQLYYPNAEFEQPELFPLLVEFQPLALYFFQEQISTLTVTQSTTPLFSVTNYPMPAPPYNYPNQPIVDGLCQLVLSQSSHEVVAKVDQNVSNVKPGGRGGLRYITSPWHMSIMKGKIPPPLSQKVQRESEFRKQMPIWNHRDDLLESIQKVRLTVITGRVGMGKSTQIPQFIMDRACKDQEPVRILHANPHNITPIVLSQRVAAQRGEKVGVTIGYQVFLDSAQSPVECILTYCSTSLLLRALRPKHYAILRHATHLIIDDVDERDSSSDFLMFLVTQLLELKDFSHLTVILIINSETPDPEIAEFFGNYFKSSLNSYSIIDLTEEKSGLGEMPSIEYVDFPLYNYNLGSKLSKANEALYKIHTTQPLEEAVLLFVPNYEEMLSLKESIFHNHYFPFDSSSYVIHMIHPELERADLEIIFDPVLQDKGPKSRRIILSTAILESSLSIHDVVHIIDFGNHEVKLCGTATGVYSFAKIPISKASALKRLYLGAKQIGRRYRMYSEESFGRMEDKHVPEILTFPLQEFCLIAASLVNNGRIENIFDCFITPPLPYSVRTSVDMLRLIGALEGNGKISNLGAHLLSFPVEPRFAKALIYGVVFRCIDPILTIVAALASSDPFVRPKPNEEEKLQAFKLFQLHLAGVSMSDHYVILKAFQEWEKHRSDDSRPCNSSSAIGSLVSDYICDGTFEIIYALRTELLSVLRAAGFVKCKGDGDVKGLNGNSNDWGIVKATLLVALYPNVMRIDPATKTLVTKFGRRAKIHPDSCLSSFETLIWNYDSSCGAGDFEPRPLPAHWVIYDELQKVNGEYYAKGVTVINSSALALFGGSSEFVPRARVYNSPPALEGGNPVPAEPNNQLVIPEQSDQQYQNSQVGFKLDSWIGFYGTPSDINTYLNLRTKVRYMIRRQMLSPGTLYDENDQAYVKAIVKFLSTEDSYSNMLKVEGLGRWPKFAGGNMLSAPRMGFERLALPEPEPDEPV